MQGSGATPESRIGKRRQAALGNGKEAYQEKRNEVISVAATVFNEKGYQAATLNDIAERLNTDRATLYYYIGGKQELLREVVRGPVEANLEATERIVGLDVPAGEKIRLFVDMLLASYERHFPHMFVYIQEELHRVAREDSAWARDMTRRMRRIEDLVSEIIEEGVRDGVIRSDVPARLVVMALFGMVNWTHRWFKPDRPYKAQEVAEAFSALLLDGALTKQRGRRAGSVKAVRRSAGRATR